MKGSMGALFPSFGCGWISRIPVFNGIINEESGRTARTDTAGGVWNKAA